MSKVNLAKAFKDVQAFASRHSPELLTGIGIAGMITTTILAVRATPKALQLVEAKKDELELADDEKLTAVETVKATWKCYIPATVTGVTSIACLIGASSVNARRNAALATAYNLSATALSEYKDKVIETIGEKKEQAIRDQVAEDRLKQEPINKSGIIMIGNETVRYFDSITKRRFMCNSEKIARICNELNARMLEGEDYISLNDFYYELGLEGVDVGNELGWNIYNGRKGMIKLNLHPIMDEDSVPCVVIDYEVAPKRGFDR